VLVVVVAGVVVVPLQQPGHRPLTTTTSDSDRC